MFFGLSLCDLWYLCYKCCISLNAIFAFLLFIGGWQGGPGLGRRLLFILGGLLLIPGVSLLIPGGLLLITGGLL